MSQIRWLLIGTLGLQLSLCACADPAGSASERSGAALQENGRGQRERIGMAVCVGVDRGDESKYPGVIALNFAKTDAQRMAEITSRAGFETTRLFDEAATLRVVESEVRRASQTLDAGDEFVLSFAGHGCQLPGGGGELSRETPMDEAWCLYDGPLRDDRINAWLRQFRPGVKVAVFADSCFSGTSLRSIDFALLVRASDSSAMQRLAVLQGEHTAFVRSSTRGDDSVRVRCISPDQSIAVWMNESASQRDGGDSTNPPSAAVLGFYASRDYQVALETEAAGGGVFTSALHKVWASGAYQGSHEDLIAKIAAMIQIVQSAYMESLHDPSGSFAKERPFTIDILPVNSSATPAGSTSRPGELEERSISQ